MDVASRTDSIQELSTTPSVNATPTVNTTPAVKHKTQKCNSAGTQAQKNHPNKTRPDPRKTLSATYIKP